MESRTNTPTNYWVMLQPLLKTHMAINVCMFNCLGGKNQGSLGLYLKGLSGHVVISSQKHIPKKKHSIFDIESSSREHPIKTETSDA